MERRVNIRQYANKGEDINETLNRIAILAKEEVEDYYTGICDNNKYITRIKAHYLPLIERLVNNNWYKMNNEVHFIEDCLRKIRYAIRTFDINTGNFDKRVKVLLYQSVRQYCGNRGKKRDALRLIGDISTLGTLGDYIENTEESAIYNACTYEESYETLYRSICEKKIDKIILDSIFDTIEGEDVIRSEVTESEITRTVAQKMDRSFNSARGAVRGFKQRLRKRNVRREDIA
ncbi:hypothetical protein COM38_07415 [Bacillus toyonensis]|uniref:hypothetical protein n=1 Tax=Bacillus toyonensis TaxID=155322 RepID=UPI000BF4B2E2|nr:hypothetical protein [Bacillus toyonensis]MCU5181326.1 hypothetical protein [Bacillus toyonensis]PGD55625.1 hypothetical protein COM38_07415 [Bacillus toyonensis]